VDVVVDVVEEATVFADHEQILYPPKCHHHHKSFQAQESLSSSRSTSPPAIRSKESCLKYLAAVTILEASKYGSSTDVLVACKLLCLRRLREKHLLA
jgi:hypothetical protein